MTILIIKDYGVKLSFRKGMIVILKNSKVIDKIPLANINQILILTSGVSISSKLIRTCLKNFIDIVFFDHKGEPIGRIYPSILGGTVIHRRHQYEAYMNGKAVKFVKAIIYGKITNQANLLKYLAKNRRRRNFKLAQEIELMAYEIEQYRNELHQVQGVCIDTIRQDVLVIEAKAARKYWETLVKVIPEIYEFKGRDQDGEDIVNKSLNYAYGILKSIVWKAILLHNLDPYAGFLHVDKSGRPSLVLDFMEEFRPIIDRIIITMFTQGIVNVNEVLEEDGRLKSSFRSEIAKRVFQVLSCYMKNNNVDYLESIVNKQISKFVKFLKDQENYEPYIAKF